MDGKPGGEMMPVMSILTGISHQVLINVLRESDLSATALEALLGTGGAEHVGVPLFFQPSSGDGHKP